MRNRAVEYPHPVLNEHSKDFIECAFSLNIVSHSDNGSNIDLEIEYTLKSIGISQLLHDKKLRIVARITCFRTSYRTVFDLNIDGTTIISIPKKQITDVVDIQGIIVAYQDLNSYSLDEFNKGYFGKSVFSIKKGAVVANEPGIKIKLNTLLEKSMAGIVLVSYDASIAEMKINFATAQESDPALTNYIIITLPEHEYISYTKLRTKKHLKNGVDRFLQASLILPVITEAIGKLRMEEMIESEDEQTFKGTVWADSIYQALLDIGVDELATCTQSDFLLADKLLGKVTGDSIRNLMQKLEDWSTIRQEDEVL